MKSEQRRGDAEQEDLLNKKRLLEDEIRVLKSQLERSLEGVSDYQKKHDALQISLMDVSVKAAQSSTYAVQRSHTEATLYENVDNTQTAANTPLKPQRSAPAIPSKNDSNVSDVKDTSEEKAADLEKKDEKPNDASNNK